VLRAIGSVAAATALAAPLMLSPALVAAPAMRLPVVAPALASTRLPEMIVAPALAPMVAAIPPGVANAPTASGGRTGGGGIVLNVNVTYNVKADSPADWEQSAHRHADTLMRIIDEKLNRRARLRFD